MTRLIRALAFTGLFFSVSTFAQSTTVEVLATEIDPVTGEEVASAVLLTDDETGAETIIGLDQDPERAKVKLVLATRARLPELLGVRAGVNFNDRFELGLDIGTVETSRNFSLYAHQYFGRADAAKTSKAYVSAKLGYQELNLIFLGTRGIRGELLGGYKFDRKPGGLHTFVEIGLGRNLIGGEVYGWTAPEDGSAITHPLLLPTVGIGIGWTIPMRKHR